MNVMTLTERRDNADTIRDRLFRRALPEQRELLYTCGPYCYMGRTFSKWEVRMIYDATTGRFEVYERKWREPSAKRGAVLLTTDFDAAVQSYVERVEDRRHA